jgi:hypothetical protein
MIRLKHILLEHPQGGPTDHVDVTKFTNKCNEPGAKTALQDAFKQAKKYWISRFDSNAWRLKYTLAHPDKKPDEVVNLINKYKQAIQNANLTLQTEMEYTGPSGTVETYMAFVLVTGGVPTEVYARCDLASFSKKNQISTMVHELAHILFRVSPFNSFIKMQKAFNYLVNRPPLTRKVNFDERRDLIRQRMKQDPDVKRYMEPRGLVDLILDEFLQQSKTNKKRMYYCSETEKQSNLASLNYALGRINPIQSIGMPITPKMLTQVLNGEIGEGAYVDARFLIYCWIASLGMKYGGGNPDNTNNSPWPTLADFCKNLSKLVAKQKPPATRNNMPPEGRA